MNRADCAAVWDLMPVSTWLGPWADLLQISGSPAVRITSYTLKLRKWEPSLMRKNQLISNQVRFYTPSDPAYSVNINEVYFCVDAFICVCRGADRHMPHPTLSLLQGDSDSPASSRTVKENWVIRHKWRQQRGICQCCCQRQLPLNYHHHDKGRYWRLERITQVNQDGFILSQELATVSVLSPSTGRASRSIKMRSHFLLISLNQAAYET